MWFFLFLLVFCSTICTVCSLVLSDSIVRCFLFKQTPIRLTFNAVKLYFESFAHFCFACPSDVRWDHKYYSFFFEKKKKKINTRKELNWQLSWQLSRLLALRRSAVTFQYKIYTFESKVFDGDLMGWPEITDVKDKVLGGKCSDIFYPMHQSIISELNAW